MQPWGVAEGAWIIGGKELDLITLKCLTSYGNTEETSGALTRNWDATNRVVIDLIWVSID